MNQIKRTAMRILLYPVFHIWLKHLIKKNYRMRAISAICRSQGVPPFTPDGKDYKDEWHWADKLCSEYGYFVSSDFSRPVLDGEIDACLMKHMKQNPL